MNNQNLKKNGQSSFSKYMTAMIRAILPATSPLYANSANTSGNTDTVSSVGNPAEYRRHSSNTAKNPQQVHIKKK
jgi:hypothetical protein